MHNAAIIEYESSLVYFVLCVYIETAVVAKSSIVLDVKPWDDETDMSEIECCVRSVETDGLLWGVCKLTNSYLFTYVC